MKKVEILKSALVAIAEYAKAYQPEPPASVQKVEAKVLVIQEIAEAALEAAEGIAA